MKTLLRFALFMAAALALVACSNMLTDLQPSADSKAATADKAALELALSGTDALTNVTGSFALPSAGAIVWASDNAAVLSADGTVARPAIGAANASVTLTATLTKGGVSLTKTFLVTVAAIAADSTTAIAEDKASLVDAALKGSNADLANVKNSLALRTTGPSGTTITWTSTNAAISSTGSVTRPVAGSAAVTVTLTATITKSGGTTVTKDFTVVVQPASSDPTTAVAEDAAGLAGITLKGSNADLNNVTSALSLPTTGPSGTTITWASDKTAISSTGVVTQPATGAANETVTLTATLTLAGGTTVTKTFTVIVTAAGSSGGGGGGGGGSTTIASQPANDTTFNTTGKISTNGKFYKRMVLGSDGSLYVAWIDYGASGATSLNFGVDKFNSDGTAASAYGTAGTFSKDATLLTGSTFINSHSENITAFAVDSTGAAYLGVTTSTGSTNYYLLKVTVAGAFDTSFGTSGILTASNSAFSALLVDGSSLLTFGIGAMNAEIKKYTLAGVIDTTFGDSSSGTANITSRVATADSTFVGGGYSTTVSAGATLLKGSNGNYYLPFSYRFSSGDHSSGVFCFDALGASVTTFGTNGVATLEPSQTDVLAVTSAVFAPTGELVIASSHTVGALFGWGSGFRLHKIDATTGVAVSAFTNTALNAAASHASAPACPTVFVDASGIFVAGRVDPDFSTLTPALWKFDSTTGAADTTFGSSGTFTPFASGVQGSIGSMVRSSSQILICGSTLSPLTGFVLAQK